MNRRCHGPDTLNGMQDSCELLGDGWRSRAVPALSPAAAYGRASGGGGPGAASDDEDEWDGTCSRVNQRMLLPRTIREDVDGETLLSSGVSMPISQRSITPGRHQRSDA